MKLNYAFAQNSYFIWAPHIYTATQGERSSFSVGRQVLWSGHVVSSQRPTLSYNIRNVVFFSGVDDYANEDNIT